jgi:hypothetical protein
MKTKVTAKVELDSIIYCNGVCWLFSVIELGNFIIPYDGAPGSYTHSDNPLHSY